MAEKTDPLSTAGSAGMARTFRECTASVIWAIAVFLVIQNCVIQSFRIPTGSMLGTMLIGDHLFVNKFIFGIKVPLTDIRLPALRPPRRGDVVVFQYPLDHSQNYIKRVIGLPGDVIEIVDKRVFVNGALYHNPYQIHLDIMIIPASRSPRDNFGPIRVPAHAYFMMGDNRDNSADSRFWGLVDTDEIIGLAFIRYWSWDKERLRPRWNRIGMPVT